MAKEKTKLTVLDLHNIMVLLFCFREDMVKIDRVACDIILKRIGDILREMN